MVSCLLIASSVITSLSLTSAHIIRGLQVRVIILYEYLNLLRDLVLDPRITYAELEADYAGDPELTESLELSKAALYKHFDKFYALPARSAASLSEIAALNVPLASRSTSSSVPVFDFTARFRHTQQASSVNELDDYMRLPPQDFHSCDPRSGGIPNVVAFPHCIPLLGIFLGYQV